MKHKFLAPAKVNLYLNITGKRADGYHLLETVMHTISLYDELEFYPIEKGIEIVTVPELDVPMTKNIVYRAVVALKKYCNIDKGIKIVLKKNVPLGSGLGGGSSDAATTLVALNKLWKLGQSIKELVKIAAGLGADVPFFVTGGYAFVSGIGEKVRGYKQRLKMWLVLVNPKKAVATKDVYCRYDELSLTKQKKLSKITQVWKKSDNIKKVGSQLYNCLQPAAESICPEIKKISQVLLQEKDVVGTIMSGSGSTVFAIVPDKVAGNKLLKKLAKYSWNSQLVETV